MTRQKPGTVKNTFCAPFTTKSWLNYIVPAAEKLSAAGVKRTVTVHITVPEWRMLPFQFRNRQRPNVRICLIYSVNLIRREKLSSEKIKVLKTIKDMEVNIQKRCDDITEFVYN